MEVPTPQIVTVIHYLFSCRKKFPGGTSELGDILRRLLKFRLQYPDERKQGIQIRNINHLHVNKPQCHVKKKNHCHLQRKGDLYLFCFLCKHVLLLTQPRLTPSRRRCPYGHSENHFRSYSTKSLVLKLSAHMRALTASKDQYKLKSPQHVCFNLNIFASVVP